MSIPILTLYLATHTYFIILKSYLSKIFIIDLLPIDLDRDSIRTVSLVAATLNPSSRSVTLLGAHDVTGSGETEVGVEHGLTQAGGHRPGHRHALEND